MIKKGLQIQRNYHCRRQDYDSPNGLMVFSLDSPGDYSTGFGQLGKCATAALYVAWGFHATHYNLHFCVCVCKKKKKQFCLFNVTGEACKCHTEAAPSAHNGAPRNVWLHRGTFERCSRHSQAGGRSVTLNPSFSGLSWPRVFRCSGFLLYVKLYIYTERITKVQACLGFKTCIPNFHLSEALSRSARSARFLQHTIWL